MCVFHLCNWINIVIVSTSLQFIELIAEAGQYMDEELTCFVMIVMSLCFLNIFCCVNPEWHCSSRFLPSFIVL